MNECKQWSKCDDNFQLKISFARILWANEKYAMRTARAARYWRYRWEIKSLDKHSKRADLKSRPWICVCVFAVAPLCAALEWWSIGQKNHADHLTAVPVQRQLHTQCENGQHRTEANMNKHKLIENILNIYHLNWTDKLFALLSSLIKCGVFVRLGLCWCLSPSQCPAWCVTTDSA